MKIFDVRLAEAQVSDDGSVTKLVTKESNGEEVCLAFPSDDNEFLMAALSTAASVGAQRRHNDPTSKKILPLDWWEINLHPSKDGVILSFRMPGGMEVSFHLPQEVSLRFEDVLASLLGLSKKVSSGNRH